MEDLLQSQIRDSCGLALPNGLKDLMFDISREVLRAQPDGLFKFIVDYLSALLLVRETLPIACYVCREVCECSCQPELEEELKDLGLEGEDLVTAKNVVMKYFDKGEVKEGNLLMQLFNKTSIDEDLLPSIQEAVRTAFWKHQLNQRNELKIKSVDNVKAKKAMMHTMGLYERNDDDFRNNAATKIQAYFRGYLVRRNLMFARDKFEEIFAKTTRSDETTEQENAYKPGSRSFGRLSSYSLAGSFLSLPKYIPYSAHHLTNIKFDENEIECKSFDFTKENNLRDIKVDGGKKIMFQDVDYSDRIESRSLVEEIDEEIEEEDMQSDITSVDESIIEEAYYEQKKQTDRVDDEIIEEKQLHSTMYEEQKHRMSIEHELKIMLDDLINESLPFHDKDMVKERHRIQSFDKLFNENDDFDDIVDTDDIFDDYQSHNKDIIEEENDDQFSDEELNEQHEELIALSNFIMIKRSKKKQQLKYPSDNTLKQNNNEVLGIFSDNTIKEQKDSNRWVHKPTNFKIVDQENINKKHI